VRNRREVLHSGKNLNWGYLILNTIDFPSLCFNFFARPRATIVYSALRREKLSPKRSGLRPFWANIAPVMRCPLNRREIFGRLSIDHVHVQPSTTVWRYY